MHRLVDFAAYCERRAARPEPTTVLEFPSGEPRVPEVRQARGMTLLPGEGGDHWLRWEVVIDPVLGCVCTTLSCDGRTCEHELRFAPDESEVERWMREGVMHYWGMILSLVDGVA